MSSNPDTEYVLSLSYGKDSLACLFAIEQLGWPLNRIIPADMPPMVEFKAKADKIIKERWSIEVEHLCAVRNGEKLTYEKLFYHIPKRKSGRQPREGNHEESERRLPASLSQSGVGAKGSKTGLILGFPMLRGQWCTSDLKRRVFPRLPCTRSEEKYCAVPRYCG